MTYVRQFGYLNSSCIRKSIKFTLLQQISASDDFGGVQPPWRHPYANLCKFGPVKHFPTYLELEKLKWAESWQESLHIYLLSFPRFWTLSIELFWFLFWSILNGVTLKTSNKSPRTRQPGQELNTAICAIHQSLCSMLTGDGSYWIDAQNVKVVVSCTFWRSFYCILVS